MPPRSTGCFTCRKRKIRCDEGRPGCDKCAKHGVPCPGYRRERAGFEFEDQTAVTVQRAQGQRGSDSLTVSRKHSQGQGNSRLLQNMWQTSDVFHSWTPLPQTVASPAVAQEQMYDKFIDIYTPQSGIYTGQFDYLRTISQMVQTQPALKDGLDTLALVQVGSVYKDERLLDASVRSYGKALGNLAKAVAKATSVRDDTVLAAASLLVVCEFYDKIKTAGVGWFGHIMGVEQLLLARGPDSLTSDLALWLFYNARVGSLARSFLLRRSDPYSSQAWRLAAFRAPVEQHMSLLFDSVGQIPGLLERHDRLEPEGPDALSAIEALLDECENVEQSLRGWMPSYHRTFEAKGLSPYSSKPIENFGAFTSVVSDRTLTTAYEFQGYTCGYVHSQYWIGMHYLRSTIKSLREARQDLDFRYIFEPAKAVTDEELHEYAFSLCRCLPYFLEPSSGTQGHIGCFLSLAVILFHFRTRQNWKWLRWGLEVKTNIFNKGLRQPQVREEDLPTAKMLAPPRKVSMFHHGSMERDEFAQNGRSRDTSETGTQPTDAGFYDDMADVSLAIDWGQTAPGMLAVATGISTVQNTEDSNDSWSVDGFNDAAFGEFDDAAFDTTLFADLDYSTMQ